MDLTSSTPVKQNGVSANMNMEMLIQQRQRSQQSQHENLPDAHEAIHQSQHEGLPDAHEAVCRPSQELLIVEEVQPQVQMELAVTRRMLAAERQRYQELFESVPDAHLVTDVYGTIWEANGAAAVLFNMSPQLLVSKPLTCFMAADEQSIFGSELARLRSTGGVQTWQVQLHPQNGTPINVIATVVPIHDRNGKLVTLRWWLRDLTSLKRSEQAQPWILAREQAAHTQIEVVQQHFALLTEAGNVLSASLNYEAALQSILRLVVPRLADWCMLDVVEEDGQVYRVEPIHADLDERDLHQLHRQRVLLSQDAENDPITRALRTGVPELVPTISDEWYAKIAPDADHLSRFLRLTSAMIVPLVVRGHIVGTMTLLAASHRLYQPADLDLAKELAFRAALTLDNIRLDYKAQAAVRDRDEFLSIAAHELNNPICTLRGYVQLLQRWGAREPALHTQDQQVLQRIDRQTERLHRLIMMLLEFARIQAGRFSLRTQVVDLSGLARQVVEQFRPTLDKHTIELTCAEEMLLVDGDAWCLELVLQNLLQNAVKYSPAGGPITVQIERCDDRAYIVVRDQGIGIPKAAQPHIFQRFYRACNIDPQRTNGLGIGLYLVKELVAQHGGTVELSSTEGQGSTFTLGLPMHMTMDYPGATGDQLVDSMALELGA